MDEITEIKRGKLTLVRDSDGVVSGAILNDVPIIGFRSAEQKLVTNTKAGTYLAVTLAIECDSVSFIDLEPGESGGESDGEESEEASSEDESNGEP